MFVTADDQPIEGSPFTINVQPAGGATPGKRERERHTYRSNVGDRERKRDSVSDSDFSLISLSFSVSELLGVTPDSNAASAQTASAAQLAAPVVDRGSCQISGVREKERDSGVIKKMNKREKGEREKK